VSAAPTPEEAPTRTCVVCRRPFWRNRRRRTDATCSQACADAYQWRTIAGLSKALILAKLARPVAIRLPASADEPPRTTASLLLEPVPDRELAQRRAALPWVQRQQRERSGRPRRPVETNGRPNQPEEPSAMSERNERANRGRDTADRRVFNADGSPAMSPSGNEMWTQREWQGRDKAAGFYREDDADDDAEAEPAEGE
jgi:hypothetical protein